MTRAGTTKQEPRSPKKVVIREPRLATGNGPLRLDSNARPTYSLPTSASLSRSNSLLHAAEGSQSASNVTTFYAFGNNGDDGEDRMGANGFDFTPSVNLEDVHRSIIDSDSQTDTYQTESDASTVSAINKPRGPRNTPGSVLRRPSISKYGSGLLDQSPHRTRRTTTTTTGPQQSSLTSTVRKPTIITDADQQAQKFPRRRPSIINSSPSTPPLPQSKEYLQGSGFSRTDSKFGAVARTYKAKSLQPPPRESSNANLSITPDHVRSSSIAITPKSPRSPRLRMSSKLTTPGSANRRISTIPHASGLGARTISPTDARRIKRLSSINTPPPVPRHLEMGPPLPGAASPSLIPRKSTTPSSSGTTPEPPVRKSNPSVGASVAAGVRASVGSLQPRMSQNLSASRLPTAKNPRPTSSRGEDDIPPVPPLPIGLVPNGERSQPPSRFSVLPPDTPVHSQPTTPAPQINGSMGPPPPPTYAESQQQHSSSKQQQQHQQQSQHSQHSSSHSSQHSSQSTTPRAEQRFEAQPHTTQHRVRMQQQQIEQQQQQALQQQQFVPEPKRKRGLTLGHASANPPRTLEPKASHSNLNKRGLPPLRLPPLNVLPLSTPTIARVNALGVGGHSDSSDDLTPPRHKNNGWKTPSTPLTASKASFFGSFKDDVAAHQRSTSSINNPNNCATPSSASFRADSSSSSNFPANGSRVGQNSPYVPKTSSELMSGPDPKSAKILGIPIAQAAKGKLVRRPTQEESTDEAPETPQSTTSIRRKLSLSWKRSSSKSSHAAAERESEYVQPKYENMPPPRLPTSNWPGTQQATSTPSPVKLSQESRRRKSSISGLVGHDRHKSESWSANSSPKTDSSKDLAGPLLPTKSSTVSLLSPVQKILSTKQSLSQMRRPHQPSAESFIEQEEKLAEEEMLKIARRRKNLDEMARELDRLNERAYPKEKMSPPHAMKAVGLNIFERGEIVDYKDVYFCGTKEAKKHVGDLNTQSGANFGYDDDRGDYAIVPGDHLAYRYEIIDVLGKGSFGQVVRCIDHKTGGLVAIKIIRNKKRFHQQALVEVNILQKLREWDRDNQYSLVSFVQSFYFRGHLCISTELLGMNLYEFIKSNDFRGFSLRLIRTFTRQMLGSLILLKQHRVIHCDLKPENILLAHPAKTEIKVIDFGSSCFENEKVYTYIQSRFYRSPEVILGMSYGLPIDMWSLGCILAELFTGYPIFPGENEQEQLACIMEVFGPPERHLIEKSTRRKLFFDSFNKPRTFISAKGRRRKPSSKSLRQALKCEDEPFLDFVARCLRWDPDKRMKPEEALKHSFITGIRMSAPPRSRGSAFDSTSRFASRTYTSSTSTQQPQTTSRPLPEPPAGLSSVKPRIPASPLKSVNSQASGLQSSYGSQSKRNSIIGAGSNVTVNALGSIKRTSATGGSQVGGSSLPRMAGRPGSGKVPTPP